MTFADWWIPNDGLVIGPERWSALANHTVSPRRAVGGKLVANDLQLVFLPNRVDRTMGGQVWRVPLVSITSVGTRSRTGNPFNGGLRRRLRLVTSDGAEHLFVVNRLSRAVEELQALIAQAR